MPTTTGISFDGVNDQVAKAWTGKTASNNKKFTAAAWFELPVGTSEAAVLGVDTQSGSGSLSFGLTGSASFLGLTSTQTPFVVFIGEGGSFALLELGAATISYGTKYFIMVVYDSAQATAANRLKVWFGPEGGAITLQSWTFLLGSTYPTLNDTLSHGTGTSVANDGVNYDQSTPAFYKGRVADVYWLDNVALANPSSLLNNYASAAAPGTYSGSYGTTGYHLDFSNSGALGADSSGNSNTFTAAGGPTQLTGYFPAGGFTADLAATEASDTASIALTAAHTAALAATEAADTAAIALTAKHTAALAATEATDTASIALTAKHTAVLAATEAADTVAIALTAKHTAALAATEASDVVAINVLPGLQVSMAATEAPDVALIVAGNFAAAALAVTEAPDTAAIALTAAHTAALATTEASDTAAIALTAAHTAALAATEAADTAAFALTAAHTAVLAATEAVDTASIALTAKHSAALAATEAADIVAINVVVPVAAALAATEAQDTAVIDLRPPAAMAVPTYQRPGGLRKKKAPKLPLPVQASKIVIDEAVIRQMEAEQAAFRMLQQKKKDALQRVEEMRAHAPARRMPARTVRIDPRRFDVVETSPDIRRRVINLFREPPPPPAATPIRGSVSLHTLGPRTPIPQPEIRKARTISLRRSADQLKTGT